MPTPTNRTPVRVARGTYSNLNTNKADIQEGEICYATDQDKLYVKEGSNLVDATPSTDITGKANIASPTFTGTPAAPTASQGTNTTQVATTAFVNAEIAADLTAAIGSTVQAYDADTAKRDTTNTYTQLQTLNAGIAIDGPYKQAVETVGSTTINLSTGNYFTKTISGNTTFTFSNPPSSGTVGSFTLELTHSSGTVTWPSSVKFPADTAPTLTTGKTHLFMFVTDDGGTRYRGAALADYVN